jgi:hypothetical protein
MTKEPNPNQIPMTKPQILKEEGFCQVFLLLVFGHWNLGFDWDLAPWSLGILSKGWIFVASCRTSATLRPQI